MAKVKIQGHASGTGILTVTAPNTSTDRTITLPDEDVTLGAATPSIDDNGDATAITIDSSENVGIGTASPSVNVHIVDDATEGTPTFAGATHFAVQATASSSDNVNAALISGSAGTSRLMFGDKDDEDTGKIEYNNSTNAMVFTTNTANQLEITSDGRGLSQFTAKVWCNFNGTGTVAIFDSHNVSSVTDTGTGAYDVNFANNMANDDYPVLTNGNRASSQYISNYYGWNTTSKALIATYAMNTSTNTDTDTVSMAVFGD
jgi:hypothetical protein